MALTRAVGIWILRLDALPMLCNIDKVTEAVKEI